MESYQNPDLLDERNRNNDTRFQSWATLCLGTYRKYPNVNDIFYSHTYTRSPERPHNDSLCHYAREKLDCRICATIHHKDNHIYDNHFGNLPTHCPQWIRMGITRRAATAKQADYCKQCFDPDVFMTDVNHPQHRCKVTKATKNKFSCL